MFKKNTRHLQIPLTSVIDRANMYHLKPPECVPGMIARMCTSRSRLNMYQA